MFFASLLENYQCLVKETGSLLFVQLFNDLFETLMPKFWNLLFLIYLAKKCTFSGTLFQEKYHLEVNAFTSVQKLNALMLHLTT